MGSGKPQVRVIKRRYPMELEGQPDAKGGRFYPPEDAPVPVKRKVTHGAPKLEPSLKPGSVVILLAGNFKGKRCVFLKQLESGLLLIAGPRSVNGVPLRRVNQAYVIGTSTSVDVSGLKGKLDKFDDAYFKPKAEGRKKKGEEEFFEEGKPEKKLEMTAEMVADNKAVDAVLEKAVAGTRCRAPRGRESECVLSLGAGGCARGCAAGCGAAAVAVQGSAAVPLRMRETRDGETLEWVY